jgi:hypothetical protein
MCPGNRYEAGRKNTETRLKTNSRIPEQCLELKVKHQMNWQVRLKPKVTTANSLKASVRWSP